MIKKTASLVLAFALTISLVTLAFASDSGAPAASGTAGFTDVSPDASFAEAVEWCVDNQLMNGFPGHLFEPSGTLTRAMMATVLYRAAGEPEVAGDPAYTDTEAGIWYADAVVWSTQNGIFKGYGNGVFAPENPLTREHMALLLWRYTEEEAAETAEFPDRADVNGYAVTAVDWAVTNGVLLPREDGTVEPQKNATRAEIAVALMAALKKDDSQGSKIPGGLLLRDQQHGGCRPETGGGPRRGPL